MCDNKSGAPNQIEIKGHPPTLDSDYIPDAIRQKLTK